MAIFLQTTQLCTQHPPTHLGLTSSWFPTALIYLHFYSDINEIIESIFYVSGLFHSPLYLWNLYVVCVLVNCSFSLLCDLANFIFLYCNNSWTLRWFLVWALLNNIGMNTLLHIFRWTCICTSVGHLHGNRTDGSQNLQVLSISACWHKVFWKHITSLHYYQQCMCSNYSTSLLTLGMFLLFVLFCLQYSYLVIYTVVSHYGFIYISLITNEVEYKWVLTIWLSLFKKCFLFSIGCLLSDL